MNTHAAGVQRVKAPFPWFGGKSRVAHIVWDAFGNVPNYVEPFFGSGAVLLKRPHPPSTETVNDLDCYLANFWRAVKLDPDAVAQHADWPVNEADLLARHQWLIDQAEFRKTMRSDPDFFDAKIAGWWLWGCCCWIGAGWCKTPSQKLPHLGDNGMGINRKLHLGDNGRGEWIAEWMQRLSTRLRDVRVACGDWHRVLGDSVTHRHGLTAVFLDPPYADDEHGIAYSAGGDVAHEVADWARDNGGNPLLRIALCGYDSLDMPDGWRCHRWKAHGGFGSQGKGRGRKNAARECIWFSPACVGQQDIFAGNVAGP